MTSRTHPGGNWKAHLRTLAEALVIVVCGAVLLLFSVSLAQLLLTGSNPGHHDVVSFWAAGRQLDSHHNPYDAESILRLERSAGFAANQMSLIARNPPPALLLMMPLGFFGARSAAILWSLAEFAALIFSVQLLWRMHGKPRNRLHLLAYTFGPALSCILSGQTAIFALLGLVLFLRLHRSRPFAAGTSLWLCALKPHLFLPFGAVLLVWIVANRAWKMLAGSAAAIAFSSWVAWHFDASIWADYRQMMHSAGLEREFIPCLGVALRFAIHPQWMWLEYLPAVAAAAWAIGYYRRHRSEWDWQTHGSLLMLLSILCSPYAWMTDQSLLIPALMAGLYRTQTRAQLYIPALASAFIEAVPMFGRGMHSAWYLVTPPLLLGWFLFVTWKRDRTAAERRAAPASLASQSSPPLAAGIALDSL